MEKWVTNESLVQSYRSICISSQSILLAVGALLIDQNSAFIIIIAAIAIFQIWYIGFRITRSRTIIVDYYKFGMSEKFNIHGELLSKNPSTQPLDESTCVRKRDIRKKVNVLMTQDTNWSRNEKFRNIRHTRLKIDVLLPLTFTAMWLTLIVLSILN